VEKYLNPLAAEESASPMVKIVKNIFKLLIFQVLMTVD
jgi:hypothetical protein